MVLQKANKTYYKRNIRINEFGYSSYSEYLYSNHWKSVKKRAINSLVLGGKNHCCKKCKTRKDLCLHHKTYKTICKENLNHLIWLCKVCHNKATKEFHGQFSNLWNCHKKSYS